MQAETLERTATDIVAIAAANPVALFTDEQRYSEFYEKVKAEVTGHTPDLTTDKGRKAVAALAFRVTKAKTTLDKAGKALTEEWRRNTAMVNASRGKMVAELDQLAEEVRRPLTEWEVAEEARITAARRVIDGMRAAAVIAQDDTSESVEARGREVWATEIGADFGDMADEARAAKDATVAALHAAMHRLRQEEADRAELARLRTEAAEREERERAAAEQREAERREAERVEQERVAAEQAAARKHAEQAAAAERIRVAEEQAAQRARDEVERKAAEQAAAREAEMKRAHDEEIAREREAREAAVRLAREESEARAREDAARAEREAEDRRREANRTHRAKVKRAAKEAIMTCGVSEDAAQKVVLAIIAGEIPAVSLRF